MKPEPMVEVEYSPLYPPLSARLVESTLQHPWRAPEDRLPPGVDVLVRLRFPGEGQVSEVTGGVGVAYQNTMFVEVGVKIRDYVHSATY